MTSTKAEPVLMKERSYRLTGGLPLVGDLLLGGAKNAAGKQLVASLLTTDEVVFHRMPRTTETNTILCMLEELGSKYRWENGNTLRIQTSEITNTKIAERYSGFNRIPVLFLGPLLNRVGSAELPCVGGCFIGERPVDFHIRGLQAMGAEILVDGNLYRAKASRLRGVDITLEYPSVGATENLMMAASLAEGTTVIRNAAVEPEIIDTLLLLHKMGARVAVDVDRKILIEGVKSLRGTTHTVMPDRIEAASFAVAAAATNGSVNVIGAKQIDMLTFLNRFVQAGGKYKVHEDGILFERGEDGLLPVQFETDVHPGFMTDWQQPFVVLLTQSDGVSVVHETVYESRFGYTSDLNRLGANIQLTNACLGPTACRFRDRDYRHSAIISGPTKFSAGTIHCPDLRAGFAYLVVALLADGESVLHGAQYIERGHESVPERLAQLGVNIVALPD